MRCCGVTYWLRTPNAGNANNVRNCNAGNGGALNNNNANNANAVAPIGGNSEFQVPLGKQSVTRKEFISCFLKGTKRLRTVVSYEIVYLQALTFYMKDNYFDKSMSYGHMRRALRKCGNNVRWKDSVVGYELHAPQHTHSLIEDIRNETYKISPYQRFTIYEPKRREIVATRINDRQVQMALCDGGLYQDFTEHFIYDNVACQRGKGTDFAIKRLKVHLLRFYREHKREGWVIKCDIQGFFPSTRHEVAKAAAKKRIIDDKAYKMVSDIIDSFEGDIGIGLGSQISQLLELAVLDDLDHFIKERLHIKHYLRYMDDFILIHEDKAYLQHCRKEIEKELAKIHLKLNRKTSLYPLKQGVKFLQWRFILTESGGIRIKMNSKKQGRERRRLVKLAGKELKGEVVPGTTLNSFISWKSNADKGDTYYQVKRMQRHYAKLERMLRNGNNSGTVIKNGT